MPGIKNWKKNLKQYHPTEVDRTMQLISPIPRRSMESTVISRRAKSVDAISATSTPKEESSGPIGDSMRLQFLYGEVLSEMIFNKQSDPKYRLEPIFVNGEKFVKESEAEQSVLIVTPRMLKFEGSDREVTLFNSSESSLAIKLTGFSGGDYKVPINKSIMKPASLLKIPIKRQCDYPNQSKLLIKFVLVSKHTKDVEMAFSKIPDTAQHGVVEITVESI